MTDNHTHLMTYVTDAVKDATTEVGDVLESAEHMLTVSHSHHGGDTPHHHTSVVPVDDTAKQEPTAESKPESTVDPKQEPTHNSKGRTDAPRAWYEPVTKTD
jgi:hypothetical protein